MPPFRSAIGADADGQPDERGGRMKSPLTVPGPVSFKVARLERETLHDRAYLEVKKAIMSGAIMPGSTITIRAMAAALGTSPMPVREALRRLVAERALEMLPTRSVSLPVMTAEKFEEVSRIRIALEGLVAETAAARIADTSIRHMRQINDEMLLPRVQRSPAYLAKNQEFHFTLYQAAGMPVAMSIIESLWLQSGPLLNHVLSDLGFRAANDHHGAMLAALAKGSGKATRAAVEADIADAAAVIVQLLRRKARAAG
jgi:DNA-binding GntR family transcriptional regulator